MSSDRSPFEQRTIPNERKSIPLTAHEAREILAAREAAYEDELVVMLQGGRADRDAAAKARRLIRERSRA